METDPIHSEHPRDHREVEGHGIEMPRPTAAPLVLSVGLVVLAAGAVTSWVFVIVGGGLFLIGLATWLGQLLPGRGHMYEPLAAAAQPAPFAAAAERVEHLRVGVPGYRLRLPERVHPISAGIKGGMVGGLVMPLPALAYGALSGHGIWYPVNLLAAMVLPGMDNLPTDQLERFNVVVLIVAVIIHAAMSVVLGLIYGVLMPTLPDLPKPLAWGALLAPMLWTGVSFVLMGAVNPVLQQGVDWPWFIASQFLFGVVMATFVMRHPEAPPLTAAVGGAGLGGLLMALPAMLWSKIFGHGIWYPVNLLAAMIVPGMDQLTIDRLTKFHFGWLIAAMGVHAAISLSFGVLFGLLLRRLPQIPGPLAWGGMLLPLVWTAISYGMMGVVNPLLADRVDWPWFIVSQVVFGLAAAVVVVRSEMVHVPPAGSGEELSDAGEGNVP
ncbi:MAG TPA: hypothetical protein VG826_16000 [Pirellulales bacterium]|nr:hypothetical protein [Pirellulales bacterium]